MLIAHLWFVPGYLLNAGSSLARQGSRATQKTILKVRVFWLYQSTCRLNPFSSRVTFVIVNQQRLSRKIGDVKRICLSDILQRVIQCGNNT